jgi:WD40 repeat protein
MSNRTRDYSRQSLYIRDLSTGKLVTSVELQQAANASSGTSYTFSCGLTVDPVVNLTSGSFDYSPDGKSIVFSKTMKTRFGEMYNDLFELSLVTKKTKRLTKGKRLTDPAWSPDGKTLVALQPVDGTLNLVKVDLGEKTTAPITSLKNGEQLFLPVWSPDGRYLLSGWSFKKHRSIVRIDASTGELTVWKSGDGVDYRDPSFSQDGRTVYYSASENGVFNVYSADADGTGERKLTEVTGGAFQPVAGNNGTVYLSQFTVGGFKIAQLLSGPSDVASTTFSPVKKDENPQFSSLHTFSDTIADFVEQPPAVPGDTLETSFELNGAVSAHKATLSRYRGDFTKTSLFPIVRFDNYSRLNGSNGSLLKARNFGGLRENLVRDAKGGLYFSSRDVRDRVTLFGGAMFGPGSYPVSDGWASAARPNRLASLDRDLFLILEHQGLPFFKGFWNPTISLELYNLRRNVANGLQIEDFSCSACLPDTIGVDIAYDIWQADVFLRSKIDLFSMVELGVSHSPYKVTTESFFSGEYKQVVPKGSSRYFIGTTLSAAYIFRFDIPSAVGDVVPVGSRGSFRMAWQPARLLNRYEIRDGTLLPVYARADNVFLETQFRRGWATKRGGLSVKTRFFSYLNSNSEYFYLDYIGGYTGMRSYPFFALGGNTTAFAELSGYLPIWDRINRQYGRFTINSVWMRGFLEAGNGWRGPLGISNSPKTGAGAELRVSTNSYYLFPSKFFISTAYGFDRFSLNLPSGFVGTDAGNVTYGREWLFYFGLLFDFEL